MLRVIGEVVDYTENPWEMRDDKTGVTNRGTTRLCRVQTSRKDFIDVRLPEDWAQKGNQWPQDGDEVDWVVDVRSNSFEGGPVRQKVNVLRVFQPAVPSPRRAARDAATASA